MSYYYTQVFKHFKPNLLEVAGGVKAFQESFTKNNLLICGESHGVRENADLAYTLCKLLGIDQLAIERSESGYRRFIESAIKGTPDFLSPQVLLSLQASVLSIEMLKTIALLVNEGIIKEIKLIDIDSKNNANTNDSDAASYIRIREAEIAKNINKLDSSQPALVLLGNYHTRLEEDSAVGASSLQMVRKKRNATYLKYNYLSGSQYNAGRLLRFNNGRSSKPSTPNSEYTIHKLSDDNFVIDVPVARRIHV